jgi:hypothetical protein
VNPSQRVSQYAHTGLSLGNVLSLSMINTPPVVDHTTCLVQALPAQPLSRNLRPHANGFLTVTVTVKELSRDYVPVQLGLRFSRKAQMPSCASAAMEFMDMTAFVRSYARCSSSSTWA